MDDQRLLSVLLFIPFSVLGHATEPNQLHLDKAAVRPPAAEVRSLLSAVCPGRIDAYKDDKDEPEEVNAYFRGLFGCSGCPHFTHPPWAADLWKAVAIHYGHFSSPEADEAAVATEGCEPHSLDWGGTAFFVRSGGKWRMKWYQAALITKDCMEVQRTDGRMLLVCANSDGAQSVLFHTLSFMDLSLQAKSREKALLTVKENPDTCGQDYASDSGLIHPVQVATYRRVSFIEQTQARLEIGVEYGWRAFTPENSKSCLEAERKKASKAGFMPKTKFYNLTFEFDGNSFRLRPEDRKTKRLVETYVPAR